MRPADALDIIEYGVSADEPSLDGATIAEAHRLLTRLGGLHVEPALALIGSVDAPQPSFVMTYTRVGRELQVFLRLCARNDLSGVLDIDLQEAGCVAAGARTLGLAVISLTDARASQGELEQAVSNSEVVYLEVAAGSTGQGLDLTSQRQCVVSALEYLRTAQPDLLVAAGIGVQTPDHVAVLVEFGVDMVVVGTGVVEPIARGPEELGDYPTSLRAAFEGAGERASPRLRHRYDRDQSRPAHARRPAGRVRLPGVRHRTRPARRGGAARSGLVARRRRVQP